MTKREKVSFEAHKKVIEPKRVDFVKRDGEEVRFKAHEKVREKVKVEFYRKKQ